MTTEEFAHAMGQKAAEALAAIAADMKDQGASEDEVDETLSAVAEAWREALVQGCETFREEMRKDADQCQ